MGIFHFNNTQESILDNSGQPNRKISLMKVFSEGVLGNSNIGPLFYLTNMGFLVTVDPFIVITQAIQPIAHMRSRTATDSNKHYLSDKSKDTIKTSCR